MVSNVNESGLVLIADWIYSINLHVLDKRSKEASLRKALRLGDKKQIEVEGIVNSLPSEKANLINIVRWKDLAKDELYKKRVDILVNEFKKKSAFYTRIIEIVRDNFKNSPKHLELPDFERLADYILYEMPMFLSGIEIEGITYDALLYPKIGLLDVLEKDLQDGIIFPKLTKQLEIKSPAAIIEVYVD